MFYEERLMRFRAFAERDYFGTDEHFSGRKKKQQKQQKKPEEC